MQEPIIPGALIPHEVFYITPTPLRLESLFFQVNRAGITSRTPRNFIIRRKKAHVFHVIHCVTAGHGSVTVRGKSSPLSAGDVFLLPAYEPHIYQSDPHDPMGLTWVEFSGGNSDALCNHIFNVSGCVQRGRAYEAVLSDLQQLFQVVQRDSLQASRLLYQMMLALCDAASAQEQAEAAQKDAILSYLDENLASNLTVAQVAHYFGYHPNYFSSLFTHLVGEPFSKHLIYRRVSRACQLLMTTNLSVQSIATAVGFFDSSHLYRNFKQICGLTPVQYRKENYGLIHDHDLSIHPNIAQD